MAAAGIRPVNQPQHYYNWGEGVEAAIGTPGERFHPLGEFERAGVPMTISSDAPVAEPIPLEAIQAAVTRVTRRGHRLGNIHASPRSKRGDGAAGVEVEEKELKVQANAGGGDEARVAWIFRRCTSRVPNPRESAVLLDLLRAGRDEFAARPRDAAPFAFADPTNPTPLPEGLTVAELAAWTTVTRAILNLDETITKE